MRPCDSIDWYEGDHCSLAYGHAGVHRDAFGLTWTGTAHPNSNVRMHGECATCVEIAYAKKGGQE